MAHSGRPKALGAIVAVALVALFVSAFAGCGSGDTAGPSPVPSPGEPSRGENGSPIRARPGEPQDLATVRRIHSRYGDVISASFDGVVGHGVAADEFGSSPEPDDNAFVIAVFVENAGDEPEGAYSIRSVPLRFKVTGQVVIQ